MIASAALFSSDVHLAQSGISVPYYVIEGTIFAPTRLSDINDHKRTFTTALEIDPCDDRTMKSAGDCADNEKMNILYATLSQNADKVQLIEFNTVIL